MLAVDPGHKILAQLVSKTAELLGGDVLGCSGDHRPQVAQFHVIAHATSRLGSIAPVGGTQSLEHLLHDGETRLGALAGLRRLLAGSARKLLLGGLADRADSLVRQPFGDCPLLGLKRGQPGVAVLTP